MAVPSLRRISRVALLGGLALAGATGCVPGLYAAKTWGQSARPKDPGDDVRASGATAAPGAATRSRDFGDGGNAGERSRRPRLRSTPGG
jgi:hypothetical protein